MLIKRLVKKLPPRDVLKDDRDAATGFKMSMFGTNGVRGIANGYLSCELALQMGRAVSTVLGKRIAVATDTRVSSPMLRDALCAGLMSVGADVLDLGMVPTPALQHFIKQRPYVTGGVMITASHNPPEFNGIKCISGDGTECSKDEETAIESAYATEIPCVPWAEIGNTTHVSTAGEEYVDSIVSKVDAQKIRDAKLTVCVDCANGASVLTTPLLLKKLGVRAITINGNPQGEFPGHPSEPTEDNLSELKRMVTELGADLGIAHDGDADRCVFIDEKGRYVSGDVSLSVLSGSILRRNGGGKIVITVATSSMVKEVTESNNGEIVYTAVGSPIVARRMAAEGGVFGGEENGGLIFADHQYCRDGAMGAARMLECIATDGALGDQISRLPKYTTIKKAVVCPDHLKASVSEAIATRHADENVNTTDGVRIDYDDGWVLMRASGTEPKFRIYSESKDAEKAAARAERFVEEFEVLLSEAENQ